MNSKLSCSCCRIRKLVCVKTGVFVWKPPFLLALLAMIFFPCAFHPAFAQHAGDMKSLDECFVMDGESIYKDSVGVSVSVCAKGSNIGGDNRDKVSEGSGSDISSMNSEGDKSGNQGRNNPDRLHWHDEEEFSDFVQLLLIILISFAPAFWAAYQRPGFKPNVKAGAPPVAAPEAKRRRGNGRSQPSRLLDIC